MGHPELFSRACERSGVEYQQSETEFRCPILPRRIYVLSYIFSSMFQLGRFNFIIIIFSVVCFYSLSVYSYFLKPSRSKL